MHLPSFRPFLCSLHPGITATGDDGDVVLCLLLPDVTAAAAAAACHSCTSPLVVVMVVVVMVVMTWRPSCQSIVHLE
jgi:hypothetical protein